jgi:hypothetical protein
VAARPVCATCDLAIPWAPTRVAGRAYCCRGCAAGGPCTCTYDLPADDEAPDDRAGRDPVVAPGLMGYPMPWGGGR